MQGQVRAKGSERVRFNVVMAAALSLLIAACTSAETDPVSASTVPLSAPSASPDISTTSQSAHKTEVTVYE